MSRLWAPVAHPSVGWTGERVELLTKLWGEGLSASQIAKRIGSVTRNAVIGKIHRMGLSGREKPSKPALIAKPTGWRAKGAQGYRIARERPAPPPKVEAKRKPQPPTRVFLTEPKPLPPMREVATGVEAKPWLERTFGECNWIVTGQGADAMACCAPAYQRGWCRAHFRIGTTPPKSGQPRTGNELMRSLRRFAAS